MKFVTGFFVLLLLLGAVYGLAFFQIIPAQKLADKNPQLLSILKTVRLAKDKPKPKPVAVAAPVEPPQNVAAKKLAAERAKLASDRAQLEQERAAFEQSRSKATVTAASTDNDAASPRDKLISIYATMSPEDVAKILEHVPDRSVLQDLVLLDEKRAGKILAAMPADRAAKLSELMAAQKPPTTVATTHPATYLQ
jgi:flagellar motility protein MotE (MotC chaperone)